MQHYIEQLIEDLHDIIQEINPLRKTREEPILEEDSFIRHIEDVENYLHGKQLPISEITGIIPEQLPPAEKLNKQQQTQLSVELEKFLAHFHFSLDFPFNYPHYLRYTFIKNFWTEEHSLMQQGTSHIEFCDYDKENCPFEDYCNTCNEFNIEDEDTDMSKFDGLSDDEFPF